MGMSLGLQVFGHKPKYWTKINFDLLVELDEGIWGHQSYYFDVPEGDMNMCIKFHGNPSNTFWDISLKTTNVNLLVAVEENSGDHQSQ